MTLAETVLMISIGTLIIQPVTSNNVWKSFFVGLILVLTLLILEYIQLISGRLEKIISGKSKLVIEDGLINEKELMKLHLTIDQLEMHLRQNNISTMSDVKMATLEPSGRLGIMLQENAQPATKKDIEQLQNSIDELHMLLNNSSGSKSAIEKEKSSNKEVNLFTKVREDEKKRK